MTRTIWAGFFSVMNQIFMYLVGFTAIMSGFGERRIPMWYARMKEIRQSSKCGQVCLNTDWLVHIFYVAFVRQDDYFKMLKEFAYPTLRNRQPHSLRLLGHKVPWAVDWPRRAHTLASTFPGFDPTWFLLVEFIKKQVFKIFKNPSDWSRRT